jgi:hypothetical protein
MRTVCRLAALVIVLGLAVGTGVALTSASEPTTPATFVAVSPAAQVPIRNTVWIYSAKTGAPIRRLGTFGPAFTDNGLAVAPDASAVYVTLIPTHAGRRFGLRLIRIDVATRRQTFVAEGEQPAVNTDGTQLAYGAAPRGLADRDLATGATRTLTLTHQLGPAADLLDASVTWLANGSDVAIIPSPPARYVGSAQPSAARSLGSCRLSETHRVIVFVHLPAQPAPLSAHCVAIPDIGQAQIGAVAGSPAQPDALLLAADNGSRTFIDRIDQTGASTRIMTFKDTLPIAIDRSGTHLLYLLGHSPPALWEATIADGHLTDQHRLIANNRLGPVAW